MLGGLICLLGLGGCARWRAPQFTAPAGFSTDPLAAHLLNPQTRAATWERLCPAPLKLHFSGQLTASGRWWQGKERFNAFYFSYRPGQGEPALRLRGYQPQLGITLFEILVREGQLTVLLPGQHTGFSGPIPSDGSPFRGRFGVEPWQMDDLFLIGRALATTPFQQQQEGKKLVLTPNDAATTATPTRIELDAATGLPMRAVWSLPSQTYEVRYLAWDWFSNESATETAAASTPQLMPRHLQVIRFKPHTLLDLAINHYQFGAEVPPLIFTPYLDEPVKLQPLDGLGKVLGDS